MELEIGEVFHHSAVCDRKPDDLYIYIGKKNTANAFKHVMLVIRGGLPMTTARWQWPNNYSHHPEDCPHGK